MLINVIASYIHSLYNYSYMGQGCIHALLMCIQKKTISMQLASCIDIVFFCMRIS